MKKPVSITKGKIRKKRRKLRIKMWCLKRRRVPRRLIDSRFFYSVWFKGTLLTKYYYPKNIPNSGVKIRPILVNLKNLLLFGNRGRNLAYSGLGGLLSCDQKVDFFKIPAFSRSNYFLYELPKNGAGGLSKFVNWLNSIKAWKYMWQVYRKIFLKSGMQARSIAIEDEKRKVLWGDKSFMGRVIPRRSWFFLSKPNLYLSALWSKTIRMKLEKFFFQHSDRRTYIWMHSIWNLVVRNIGKWPKYERKNLKTFY